MTNIVTPTLTGDIADGAVTQSKLANTINISKFINDVGYLTQSSIEIEDLAPIVFALTGYIDGGEARETQNHTIEAGDAFTTLTEYDLNGGNA